MIAGGFIIAIAMFCVLVWVVHRRRLKQFENLDETGLASAVQFLFDSGYDGATLLVHDPESERFVQFRKYIAEPGRLGLETHFPLAPWSQQYYQSVITSLEKQNRPFEILSAKVRPTTEFVRIDFGANVDEAVAWAVDVFTQVFGLDGVKVRVRANDVDPTGSRVERADHPRPKDYLFRK
jgi:hypothetical protein